MMSEERNLSDSFSSLFEKLRGKLSSMRRKNTSMLSLSWSDLFDRRHRQHGGSLDGVILGVVIALTLIGLIMVFSASGVMAETRFRESTYFLQRQGIWLTLGFLIMFVAARLDYGMWRSLTPKVLIGCVALLLLVLFIGSEINGARRWLHVSWFSIQPSELAKLAIVLYLAMYLAKPDLRLNEWRTGFLPPVLVVGAMSFLIVIEPDFGSAVVMGTVMVSLLYLAGARYLHLLGLGLLLVPLMAGLVLRSPERLERLVSFWNPWVDATGSGYQLVQSFVALQHGGVFGVGLAQGRQKLLYLPEGHTDFVLALLGEELGLIGTTTLLVLFAVLVIKGFRVAAQARDVYGRYLALGITLLLGIQALMNAGVVSGLLPTKGLTLPFVSYGGSSLLTSMLAVGMLLSVARHREVQPQ
jgi:cell division protein FtsW